MSAAAAAGTVSVVALAAIFTQEIKQFVVYVCDTVVSYFTVKLTIDRTKYNAFKPVYALTSEIQKHYPHSTTLVDDAGDHLEYDVANGTYRLGYENETIWTIFVTLCDDKVYVWTYGQDGTCLKAYLDYLYSMHTRSDKILQYYSNSMDDWKQSVRRPIQNIKVTKDMQVLLDDVEQFMSPETVGKYKREGWPYRKGYLVHGPGGTGKSLIVRLLATKYNMPIYMINLNTDKMNDSRLCNLLSSVKPGSLVVIDEMDKQYEAIRGNPELNISTAGILTALAGPLSLSHGVIVVITANHMDKFDEEFKTSLIRKGRIDTVLCFNQKLN